LSWKLCKNELKEKDSLQLCDLSTNEEESTFYHSHSIRTSPISLSLSAITTSEKYEKNSDPHEMVKWAIYRILVPPQLASRVTPLALAI
jgi:hypothetical protein